MKKLKSNTPLLLQSAIAGLFVTGAVLTLNSSAWAKDAKAEEVKCYGINGCKGKGACGMAHDSSSCAGNNACKGQGWIKVSPADCTAQKGVTTEKEWSTQFKGKK